MASVVLDWSENLDLFKTFQAQSAFFNNKQIAIHQGYVYWSEGSYGVAAMSDYTGHKAEACWAGYTQIIDKLVSSGVKYINFISDSPTSQYRNGKNIYLLQQYCIQNNIMARWIWLEAGHGKGVADGIGGRLKTTIDTVIATHPHTAFNSLASVFNMTQENTEIQLYMYKAEDVRAIKTSHENV